MKALIAATAAMAVLIGGVTASVAASRTVKSTPGHMMKSKGSYKGASRYSPGHMMQRYGSRRGYPGASGYTPSHRSTTGVR